MPTVQQEIQQLLESFKAAPPSQIGLLEPDAAKAWNVASGIQAYNLYPTLAESYPQLTPWRNMTPREPGKGKQKEYKAVTAINTGNQNGWVAEGSAANIVATAVEDIIAVYKSIALGDTVTFEGQWAGVGFADVKSGAVVRLVRAMMIAEENAIGFGQANGAAAANQQAPGAVGSAPSPTLATATTGGSIAATTQYWFKQTCITGMGESAPSASANITTGSGSTNSITVTPVFPSGQPVIGFNLYASTSSGGTYYLVASGNVSTVLSAGVLPGGSLTWLTNGDPLVVTSIPNSGTTAPASDNSASSMAYNGIYPQMWGGSGATLKKMGGALTVTGLNGLMSAMWNNAKADPDNIWCNAQESTKLNTITLGNGTPYFVMVNQQEGATANFRVARFTNPVTGSEVPVRVHPTSPQGVMLALSTKLPGWYVPTGISNVWAIDACQDYVEIDYPPTSTNPLWQVEIRNFTTLKLHVPQLCGALYAINNQ